MPRHKRAAVAGAGIGGLSAAIHLALQGYRVSVFEQAETAGGKAGELHMNGFRFDTGPSLLTMPFLLEELFSAAGRKLEDYLTLQRLHVLTKYFFSDGTELIAHADTAALAAAIEQLTGDRAATVLEYLDYCKRIYDNSASLFLFSPFRGIRTFMNRDAATTLLRLPAIDPFRTMHSANSSFFKNPKTLQLFDRYATYNGSNPYHAPATLNIIQHVEYNLGGYIIRGGMSKLPEALVTLAEELGVVFHFSSGVERITHAAGTVTGVTVHGKDHLFDAVISNIDAGVTYERLLRDTSSRGAKRYASSEPSSSALVFYFGVAGTFPEFDTHNIFFSSDYREEFRQLFDERAVPADPTVYLYVSSKINPADAPDGHENWFAMINAPYMDGELSGEELTRVRRHLLDVLSRRAGTDIGAKIVCEAYLTPHGIAAKTGSRFGSIYGISSNSRGAAFLRQPNRSSGYRNLYFCGGSAHPGGGIPLVLLSGMHAANEAIKDLR